MKHKALVNRHDESHCLCIWNQLINKHNAMLKNDTIKVYIVA
jgi:hypothetical protein